MISLCIIFVRKILTLSAESPNITTFTSYDIIVNMVYRDT